jgi:hypothetical protein
LQLLVWLAVSPELTFRPTWASIGQIGQIWPQGRTKSGQDFDPSIWPPFQKVTPRRILGSKDQGLSPNLT